MRRDGEESNEEKSSNVITCLRSRLSSSAKFFEFLSVGHLVSCVGSSEPRRNASRRYQLHQATKDSAV